MSMKRSRQSSTRGSGRGSQNEGGHFAFGNAPPEKTWAELIAGKADDAFKPYSPQATYARSDLVSHPKFGKGVVTLVEGTRVEVLFEEGAKKLGHAG
jgi:hypothetical protein